MQRAGTPPAAPPSPPSEQQPRRRESPQRPPQMPQQQQQQQTTLATGKLSDEDVAERVQGRLRELYSSGDMKDALLSFKELSVGGGDMAVAFSALVRYSLETKGTDWGVCVKLLGSCAEEGTLAMPHIHQGSRLLLNELDDVTVDVPKAPLQVGAVLGSLVASGHADLKTLGDHIRTADMEEVPEGEDTMLVDSGNAAKVVAALLQKVAGEKSEEEAAAAWKASCLSLASFVPSADRDSEEALNKLISEFALQKVVS